MSIGTLRFAKPRWRSALLACVWVLLAAPLLFAVMGRAAITSNPNTQPTLYPLQNTGSVPPLVMLVMSRDEQLYIKAYTDYTDLTNNGIPDTTYNNNYEYSGYFDSGLCYSYDSTVAVSGKNGAGAFKASGSATNHQCDGTTYSGNFMNWVAMSRVDVLRYVMYGGNRVVDTVDPDQTILERSYIPSDLHAWSKVYAGTDTNKYTPYSGTISMCNVSPTTTSEPQIRVAQGAYYNWASTAREQCMWREDVVSAFGNGSDINPKDDASSANDKLAILTARVDVCDNASYLEKFCTEYDETSSTGTVIKHEKPSGLLQKYGDNGSLRFGLISGSYFKPRDGGVLRRDIGLFAGNSATAACDYEPAVGKVDEVNLTTGQFCNQLDGDEGIINTLSRLRITSWDPSTQDYGIPAFDTTVTNPDGSKTTTHTPASGDCPTYGILQRDVSGANGHILDPDGSGGATTAYQCKDSGNPLAEMYAEALRYIKGTSANGGDVPTAAMVDESNTGGALLGLPVMKTWLDPYRSTDNGGNAYCAQCSIVVISTGLDSFDSDGIPTVGFSSSTLEAGPATTLVGNDEGFNSTGTGSPQKYLVGREGVLNSTTYQDVCAPRLITDLNQTFGICPDTPSLEGGYQLAGLAFSAKTHDMRPDLTKPADSENTVDTYAIALAESMPSFEVAVRTSGSAYDKISLTPGCQANNNSAATSSSSGWRSCYLGNLVLGTQTSTTLSQSDWLKIVSGQAPSANAGTVPCSTTSTTDPCHVFGLPSASDSNGATRGSFEVTWEDSQWGNDHDQDMIEMVSYCRGAACSYDGNGNGIADICEGTSSNSCNNVKSLQESQMLVRTEVLATYAGNAMQAGYTAGGAYNAGNGQPTPGAVFPVLRPGGALCKPTGTDSNGKTTYTDCNGSLLFGSYGGAEGWGTPSVDKLTTGPSEQVPLENPLWFAAKYGGFDDVNGDGKPDSWTDKQGVTHNEWDLEDNFTGKDDPDGVPDTYFLVRNPTQLVVSLTNAFNKILQRSGSGTAAAVVANRVNGIGQAYRASYQSSLSDSQTPSDTVSWTGSLDTLWVDSYGLLRENGSVSAPGNCSSGCALSDYTTDPIVVFTTDASTNLPEFKECIPKDATTFDPSAFDPTDTTTVTCNTYQLYQLPTLWNAESQLWGDSSTTFGKNLATQRSYTANANTGRYITTWIDRNKNGVVDSGEQTDFAWTSAATCTTGFCGATTTTKVQGKNVTTVSGNYGFLNTGDATEAQNIVNWIRGVEISGLRSRTLVKATCAGLNLAGCSSPPDNITLRLGDIVDSTPLVVGSPAEAFDQIYGDQSYATFRSYYRDRRQVVYVGADDGLLHAFNGGFYDAASHSVDLKGPTGSYAATATQDPLGSELWAYAPGNLLAHLRWLTSTGYTHVFYVDGSPIATDAKVFHDDGDCSSFSGTGMCHPKGWGTILVVPFRLGGGDIKVPVAIDPSQNWDPTGASCDGTTATNCTWKESFSAYVVMDITDPEKPPVLLGELTPASTVGGTAAASTIGGTTTNALGSQSYTTSEPAFTVLRDPTSSNPSQFVLLIGSGPTSVAQDKVTSTAALRIYAYDLSQLACQAGDGGSGCTSSGAPAGTFDMSNAGAVSQGLNSFAGDLIASDFDLDNLSEALYFGSVRDDQTSTPREYTGSLWKLKIGETPLSCSAGVCNWTPELMYDAKLPITIRPSLGLDSRSAPEIYAGTGRLLDTSDLKTTGQQQIVGMIDPDLLPSGDPQNDFSLPLASGDLLDVSSIGVCVTVVTGSCDATGNLVNGPTGVTTFSQLQMLFETSKAKGGKAGFYLKLNAPGTTPSERVISSQALLGGVLITNAYTPGTDTCTSLGSGREFATDYETGTANPDAFSTNSAFGSNSDGTGKTSVGLGPGLPSAPSLHAGSGNKSNSKDVTACTQTSTGAIICQKVTSLLPVTSGEVSWREPLDQ